MAALKIVNDSWVKAGDLSRGDVFTISGMPYIIIEQSPEIEIVGNAKHQKNNTLALNVNNGFFYYIPKELYVTLVNNAELVIK